MEAPRLRERPALVIGAPPAPKQIELAWVLMITSSANAGWPGDISLHDRFAECGLVVPCLIRTAKIATVEVRRVRVAGLLPLDLQSQVRIQLLDSLGIAGE